MEDNLFSKDLVWQKKTKKKQKKKTSLLTKFVFYTVCSVYSKMPRYCASKQ